jgi:hypothetical protein
MAKLLTRLRIDEVSAVDAGAGRNVKIMLMKRDQDNAVAKATAALQESVASILDCDDDDATKRDALAETFAQFESYVDRNVGGSQALSKGPLERAERARREKFEKIFAAKAADDDGDHVAKADREQHVGHHALAAAVVEHTLDRLDSLRERHGFKKHVAEESIMDTKELVTVLKQDGAAGLAAVCKRVIAEGASGISENDFVSAVTDHARERFADLPSDQDFAKLYEADVLLRKALRVVRDGAWGYASAG